LGAPGLHDVLDAPPAEHVASLISPAFGAFAFATTNGIPAAPEAHRSQPNQLINGLRRRTCTTRVDKREVICRRPPDLTSAVYWPANERPTCDQAVLQAFRLATHLAVLERQLDPQDKQKVADALVGIARGSPRSVGCSKY